MNKKEWEERLQVRLVVISHIYQIYPNAKVTSMNKDADYDLLVEVPEEGSYTIKINEWERKGRIIDLLNGNE